MMQWVKLTLHFPSFFSYRIPNYSSQYALSVPLPTPSAIKLATVATAIRTTGKVSEGERVFYAVRNAEVRILPPHKIAVTAVLIKRLKKKKNPTPLQSFESTFGSREYVSFSDDINLFIGLEGNTIEIATKYLRNLRYIVSGDSILYVKDLKNNVEIPPENVVKPITSDEFTDFCSNISCIIYPVKDISKNASFEQINPYSEKSSKNAFEIKYYPIKAKFKKGKNWKVLEMLI